MSERTDSERLDWLEANGGRIHITCWNVPDDDGESEFWAPPMKPNNGWSIEATTEDEDGDETIGRGVTARMAIDDAMRRSPLPTTPEGQER